MNIGKLIISGAETTASTIFNATANTSVGVFQTPLKNLAVSALFIYGASLVGRALVNRAQQIQPEAPTLVNNEQQPLRLKPLTTKVLLYTAAFFAFSLAVYELGSSLSHFHETGSVWRNCAALNQNYRSSYNAVKDSINSWGNCYWPHRLQHVQPTIDKANAYIAAGCETIRGGLIDAKWINKACSG